MSQLFLTAHEPTIRIAAPVAAAAGARVTTTGYKVTTKRGAISGVGVQVSGSGAWAKMSGAFSFQLRQMEKSQTYQSMMSSYNISGGVSGFFAWLGFGANASTHKEQIQTALHEMMSSQSVNGHVKVNLMVTGQYPNVQVDASAFILVLQITDAQGSTATVFSTGAPGTDVGAQDQDGHALPTSDNTSTITI